MRALVFPPRGEALLTEGRRPYVRQTRAPERKPPFGYEPAFGAVLVCLAEHGASERIRRSSAPVHCLALRSHATCAVPVTSPTAATRSAGPSLPMVHWVDGGLADGMRPTFSSAKCTSSRGRHAASRDTRDGRCQQPPARSHHRSPHNATRQTDSGARKSDDCESRGRGPVAALPCGQRHACGASVTRGQPLATQARALCDPEAFRAKACLVMRSNGAARGPRRRAR